MANVRLIPEGIRAHLGALQMARRVLRQKPSEGAASVRRIARSLKYVLPIGAKSKILEAFTQIENAKEKEMEPRLDALLPRFGDLHVSRKQDPPLILLVEDDAHLPRL